MTQAIYGRAPAPAAPSILPPTEAHRRIAIVTTYAQARTNADKMPIATDVSDFKYRRSLYDIIDLGLGKQAFVDRRNGQIYVGILEGAKYSVKFLKGATLRWAGVPDVQSRADILELYRRATANAAVLPMASEVPGFTYSRALYQAIDLGVDPSGTARQAFIDRENNELYVCEGRGDERNVYFVRGANINF